MAVHPLFFQLVGFTEAVKAMQIHIDITYWDCREHVKQSQTPDILDNLEIPRDIFGGKKECIVTLAIIVSKLCAL